MVESLSSYERMMAAIEYREPDYVPLCFMIFSALRGKCKDQYEFVEKQLELGLDAVVDLHELPIRFDSRVTVKEWQEKANDGTSLLLKEYQTPSGTLRTVVNRTADWPHGDGVPLFDDYLIPRSRKFLVENQADVKSLKHLLTSPKEEEIRQFRESSKTAKQFAKDKGLLTTAGWGLGMDAACWLCGIENLMLAAVDNPGFVEEMAQLIARWNQERMGVVLDVGVDLYVRRGWYECADFWSPHRFRQFILPSLKKEAEMIHQAGAKFGYILTTGTMSLLDSLLEAGIDVLIGVDPVQGRDTDLREMKRRLHGRICIWGGVNGFITVEMGNREEVEEAVETAIRILAPGGGFILSPVDNIRDESEGTWRNVGVLIETWKKLRR